VQPGEVWLVPAVGLVIAGTSMLLGILEPFSIVLWVSWLLHPLVVTWGSRGRGPV
jgi:hypothetical protein